MQQPREVVEKFIMPWLQQNHPNAALVFMAGSYGRAMREANYQPVASSDVDLVIIYTDLEKGGFQAATKVFKMEDVGTAMGQAPRIMMIDTNIHDFASLHYHDKVVKENRNVVFINVMIDEGYILKDTFGIGPVLQEKAAKFLEEGPAPLTKARWDEEVSALETYLADIRTASSVEEKRFLGALALIHVCDFALHLEQYWPRFNQAYRVFDARYPETGAAITDAFSKMIRTGDSADAEIILADYIEKGREKQKTAPVANGELLHDVEKNVSAEEIRSLGEIFQKFMVEHFCEALDTSKKRGELAHLSNLSGTLMFVKMVLETKNGDAPRHGRAAMHYFGEHAPDVLPAVLQGVDEGDFAPFRRIAEDSLSHVGGMHYSRLEMYYLEDMARVYASRRQNGQPAPQKFKPGFTP